mgnify:CR=1 FL=1
MFNTLTITWKCVKKIFAQWVNNLPPQQAAGMAISVFSHCSHKQLVDGQKTWRTPPPLARRMTNLYFLVKALKMIIGVQAKSLSILIADTILLAQPGG